MTVRELKTVLERVMDRLDECEDDDKIDMVSNTYFLGIAGYDGGYINLDDIGIEYEDEDEDDDYGEDEYSDR